MGYKSTIKLLELILEKGLTNETREALTKEIEEFYNRKGNLNQLRR
jgi:hypothetical protein